MRFAEVMGRAGAGIAMSLAASAPAGAADAPLPPPSEARPTLPPAPAPPPVPWQPHIEVGGGVAFTEMLASVDRVRFKPAVGFDIELSWRLLRYLGVTGYLVEHDNPLVFPVQALAVSALDPASAHTYSFGVHATPTVSFGSRVGLWLIAGVGWGHIQYGTMSLAGTSGTCTPTTAMPNCDPILPARAESFFEIPLGLGASVEIIPRWLSLRLEVTGAFLLGQTGDALQEGQFIDARGYVQNLGVMPSLDASCVQTLSLMLRL